VIRGQQLRERRAPSRAFRQSARKRLFGRPPSKSGISEMWIGALVVVAVIAIVIAAVR
jgi:hypothetical protein